MTKRLLLSGIGGSIGVHTFAHLMTNTDWHVVGIDSFRHKGWTDRVAYMLECHPEWAERLTLITHDLTAPFSDLMKKRLGKIDYIVSMASLSDVEASLQDPVNFIQNNVSLGLNLLEYAREAKPEVFIQISTDEVYGPTNGKDKGYAEWSSIVPSNPYAASKACQEAIAISYWRSYGIPLVITNTMNNFGELQQASKFPVMVQKAIESGEKVIIHSIDGEIGSRSYIHSRNHSDALLFILRNLPPHLHECGKVDLPDRYNIAGETQVDNLELAQMIAGYMGKDLEYELLDVHSTRPGHDPHYGLDGTKIEALGWSPPVPFEESLKNTVEWQETNKDWIT